jgi:hypothetical protein
MVNTFEEAFCLSIGKRPWMYLNRNICGLYNCIYEMIAVCVKMSKRRLHVSLSKTNGLIDGITIESDALFIDKEKMSSHRWDWLTNLSYFNGLYAGTRAVKFDHMLNGGAIIMASKHFSIESDGVRHTVSWMKAVEANPALRFNPDARIVLHQKADTVGTKIVWKPDFTMFEYFDGKIVVERNDANGPRCRFEDEDFTKCWSKRFESGIHTETIDSSIVADIMSACFNDPEINVNNIIMVMT